MTRSIGWSARTGLLAAACFALIGAGTIPAHADSMFFSKSSGRLVTTQWLEIETLPGGVAGNIHFGSLEVDDLGKGKAAVFGDFIDLTCPEGVIPEYPGGEGYEGGGDGEPPVEWPGNGCVEEGYRFIEGGDVSFTMDQRLTKATLAGTLNVAGYDESTNSAAVAITWTGVGDITKKTERGQNADEFGTYRYTYDFEGRAANTSGNIGAMVFGDAAGEWSTAEMGAYRSMDRERTN